MSDMNFVEKLLSNGFERVVSDVEKKKGRYDCAFNTKNGWMGVVVYHPYERFINGDKQVELSLERYGVDEILFKGNEIIKTRINEKRITVSVSGNIVYENLYGVMPPNDIKRLLYEID